MLIPIDKLPESSKVWIYQSSRLMTEDEVMLVLKSTEFFVDSWTAHQAGLKVGVKVFYNAFIVVAVDESYNDASGCSIDKKVNFFKGLEEQIGINLFDRMRFAYKNSDEKVSFGQLNELNNMIQQGQLNYDTIVFNNLVNTYHDFVKSWQVPLRDSWMMNFVDKTRV